MLKKLTLLAMALAAFAAFVAPALASASVVEMNGEPVPTGTVLTGKNEGTIYTTQTPLSPALECEEVHIAGELTVNNGTTVTGVGVGGKEENYAHECHLEDGTPITVTEANLVHIHSEETGTGTVTLTYIVDVGPVECHYEGTGVFHYKVGSNTIEVTHTVLTSTSELCENEEPEVEPITFHGNFLLTTTGGGAVELN